MCAGCHYQKVICILLYCNCFVYYLQQLLQFALRLLCYLTSRCWLQFLIRLIVPSAHYLLCYLHCRYSSLNSYFYHYQFVVLNCLYLFYRCLYDVTLCIENMFSCLYSLLSDVLSLYRCNILTDILAFFSCVDICYYTASMCKMILLTEWAGDFIY